MSGVNWRDHLSSAGRRLRSVRQNRRKAAKRARRGYAVLAIWHRLFPF